MSTVKQQALQGIGSHQGREWEKLENMLLTIVGGTLAASASATLFSDKVDLIFRHILLASWVLLSASLISLLLSYAASDYFTRDLLKKIQLLPDDIAVIQIPQIQNNFAYKAIGYCNYVAFVFGVLGLATLVLFAYLNIA